MKITHFLVPTEKYPRYSYTYMNAQPLLAKYGEIARSFDQCNEITVPCMKEVNIFYFHGDMSVDLTPSDIACCDKIYSTIVYVDSLDEFLKDLEEKPVSIFIATREVANHKVFESFKPLIILVGDNEEDIHRAGGNQEIKMSLRKDLADNIGSFLEDIILKDFLKMIDGLEVLLKGDHIHSEPLASQKTPGQKSILAGIHFEYTTKCLQRSKYDDAKELYADIQAMFYRSGKPVKSTFDDMVKTLDKKVAEELLKVQGVTSVGYELATLNIYLDDSLSVQERQFAEDDVKRLLRKHKIPRCVFHYEQRQLTRFAEVGSTLKVNERKGALGGFAKLQKQDKLCVLLSGHIVAEGNEVFVEHPPKSGEFTRFAKRIAAKSHTDSRLDIAVAEVLNEHEHYRVQFKDELGKFLPSIICYFDDLKWLSRLPVFISRAARSPGLGVIIVPALYMEDTDVYLKIEDRNAEDRFANPGDSGAIVCANHIDGSSVHILAMLIGSSNFNEVEKNPEIKRQYVAFRLNNGKMQIQEEQKDAIVLY